MILPPISSRARAVGTVAGFVGFGGALGGVVLGQLAGYLLFCTNPMDAVSPMLSRATMGSFTFHGWLICEVFTDAGLVGIGNAALAPPVTKHVIDQYLKPLLLEGADPWDTEFLWQHMYRATMAFGRKGVAIVAIARGGHRPLGSAWEVGEATGLPPARRPDQAADSGVREPALQHPARRPRRRGAEVQGRGVQGDEAAVRLGAGGRGGRMQKNVALVRTVREAVGDDVDVMADAYMGWTLDYAKRMLPHLAPFHLRWLEEAVLPDDIHGYAELKARGVVPIAGGEHEYTNYGFRELIEAKAVDYIHGDERRSLQPSERSDGRDAGDSSLLARGLRP